MKLTSIEKTLLINLLNNEIRKLTSYKKDDKDERDSIINLCDRIKEKIVE